MRRAHLSSFVRLALAALLGLATLELALRVVAVTSSGRLASALRQWDPERTLELRGAHCFRAWPGSEMRFPNDTRAHENEMGFRGPPVAVPKPSGTYRVVILGGSTTHGFLVEDDETIDAHLRRILRESAAGGVDVVNLGFDALDAICEQERLVSEGLALEPDAVILHTGINDVAALRRPGLGPDDPERGVRAALRADHEARLHGRGLWRSVKHWCFFARLPGVLRSLATPSVALPGPPEPDPQALDEYEKTVRDTIALVPPAAPVLLSMPPSRLGLPGIPTMCTTVVDDDTTRRYRDAVDERLRRIAADARAQGRDVRHVPHTLPDDVFLDDCHVDDAGNRLLAEDFARALAEAPHVR